MTSTYPLGPFTVRRVGFGAMQLPGPGVLGPPRDHDVAIAVLRRAVERGVDHIDTAQFYGPDVANELIREALHPYPDGLALVSKVGARRDGQGAWIRADRPEQLREDIEANLRSLQVDQLAAVNLRLAAAHDRPSEDNVSLEDQLEAMASARDDGLIAGVGISTATLEQVRQAHESVGLVTVQNAFSLASREDADVLDYCTEHGISYAPYFPLGSAFEHLPKVVDVPAVQHVAVATGHTPAQVGLAWLLGYAENVLLIPGTSSVEHLEENLAVADIELTADQRAELDAVG